AGRCPAQPRAPARGRHRGVRRVRTRGLGGRDRAARRGGARDGVPPLPDQGGPRRGGARRPADPPRRARPGGARAPRRVGGAAGVHDRGRGHEGARPRVLRGGRGGRRAVRQRRTRPPSAALRARQPAARARAGGRGGPRGPGRRGRPAAHGSGRRRRRAAAGRAPRPVAALPRRDAGRHAPRRERPADRPPADGRGARGGVRPPRRRL
ncbi:MAG: Transcriptional regulator, AcrR family, partial [uncultured Solirubrobacteraceae bacterium]